MTISPEHLIAQAYQLIAPPAKGRPRQADLRRAVSSAYYALFHAIIIACCDEFVGVAAKPTPAYGMAYRSIDHATVKRLFLEFSKTTPAKAYQAYWPHGGFESNLKQVANAFVELQEARHKADYDPHHRTNIAGATLTVRKAEAAIARLVAADPDQRRLTAAYLLFEPRRA